MKGVTTIYDPPEPHACPILHWGRTDHTYGTIVRCECGQYWVRKNSYDYWVEYWQRVKWWHRKERKLIRKWLAAQPKPHECDGHCILSCAERAREVPDVVTNKRGEQQ